MVSTLTKIDAVDWHDLYNKVSHEHLQKETKGDTVTNYYIISQSN